MACCVGECKSPVSFSFSNFVYIIVVIWGPINSRTVDLHTRNAAQTIHCAYQVALVRRVQSSSCLHSVAKVRKLDYGSIESKS